MFRESVEWRSWRSASSSRKEVRELRRVRVSLSDFRYEIVNERWNMGFVYGLRDVLPFLLHEPLVPDLSPPFLLSLDLQTSAYPFLTVQPIVLFPSALSPTRSLKSEQPKAASQG